MITADLKLLVDVAWANLAGQVGYHLSKGEYAAAERLVGRGLLVNGGAGTVGITDLGQRLTNRFSERLRRVGSSRPTKEDSSDG